jgi:hypothetical protein
LTARTLDVTGTLNYDFLDDARSQFVGFTPANYTVSGTISSTQGHLAGIDTAIAISTMQTLASTGNITTAPVPNVVLLNGSAINATLPLASSNTGRRIVIKKTNSLAADTVSARAGETIDGSATRTLNALERVTLLASGSTWFVI